MTTFEQRGEAFQRKFAHDEEVHFRASARRNKMLGLWAAEKLGKEGDEAEEYARSVVMTDILSGKGEDILAKLRMDFDAAGVAQSDHQIQRTMNELMDVAMAQVKSSVW